MERQTKATAYGMMYTEDKQSAIDYFNKEIKAVRATRKDFNLEIYAHSWYFSYNTFEKRRRNYASSFFFIICRRATSKEELTNRGLLLICVETTFQDIHTTKPPRTVPYRAGASLIVECKNKSKYFNKLCKITWQYYNNGV